MVAGYQTGSISRVEAFRYRSLRHVSRRLRPFQVLLGPNGSGKSTLVDALAFLCDLQQTSVEGAIYGDHRLDVPMRAPDANHLAWMREGDRFELAVEAHIPEELRTGLPDELLNVCRYEVAVATAGPPRLTKETLFVRRDPETHDSQSHNATSDLPIRERHPPETDPRGWSGLMSFGGKGDFWAYLHPELLDLRNPDNVIHRRWDEGKRAALSSYAGETDVPLVRWFFELLAPFQSICLSGGALRLPNPPSTVNGPGRDGGNLANFLHYFRKAEPKRYRLWLRHVREALPEITDVYTRERPEDHHRYLVVHYRNGLEAPSWIVSEGTLRLLALTCLAYAPSFCGPCVIEEPENGIHPTALETVIQSLSSAYDRQVLLATHSPLIATMVEPEDILCFRHTPEEGTTVLGGHEHPRLKDWQGTADLGTLLASGVL